MALSKGTIRALKVAAFLATLAVFALGVWWRSRPEPPSPGAAPLPDSVLARVNGEDITKGMLEKRRAELPAMTLERFEDDPEGFLDWVVWERILLQQAREMGLYEIVREEIETGDRPETEIVLEELEFELTGMVQPTDEELRAYFEEHEEEWEEGATYDDKYAEIYDPVLEAKKQRVYNDFCDKARADATLVKNAEWLREVRSKAADPVRKYLAEHPGKATVVDFGRGLCQACKDMEKNLEALRHETGDRFGILIVNIDAYAAAARKYGVSSIPQQIYFNADGEEAYKPDPGKAETAKIKEILETVEEKGTYEGEGDFTFKVKRLIREGSWLAVILVFVMGLLTASNPCVLATIPLIIGFIGGYKEASGLKRSFFFSLFFILGISVMFTGLGMIAGLTGSVMGDIGSVWTYVVVAVCVLVGLHLLGVWSFDIPVPQNIKPKHQGAAGSFLFGLLFGIISTPCAVPIIAVLMVLIAAKGSIVFGGLMLLVYSLGHSTLILVAGTSMGAAKGLLESKGFNRGMDALRKVAAVLLIGVGFWFLFNA